MTIQLEIGKEYVLAGKVDQVAYVLVSAKYDSLNGTGTEYRVQYYTTGGNVLGHNVYNEDGTIKHQDWSNSIQADAHRIVAEYTGPTPWSEDRIAELRKELTEIQGKCTCETVTLMRHGCQCGGR